MKHSVLQKVNSVSTVCDLFSHMADVLFSFFRNLKSVSFFAY